MRRHLFGLYLVLICLTTLSTGCAMHARSKTAPERTLSKDEEVAALFDILDVDGNGVVTRDEARGGFQYLIASYDRGGRSEILAAKPGDSPETARKKPKRRPTTQDSNRAFEALFEKSNKASEGISKNEFKKLVVKASDNPETDPFVAFY